MGTRADFYAGKGATAEWLGSVALDGYRKGIDSQILNCQSEAAYRHAVAIFIAGRNDGTKPELGWPWPWETSATSDCSYWFFDGRCWDAIGSPEAYAPCDLPELIDDGEEVYRNWHAKLERIEFPDMSARKNVTLGPRSGMIIIGVR